MNAMYEELSGLIERINDARAVMRSLNCNHMFNNLDYKVVNINGKGYAIEYIRNGNMQRVYGHAAVVFLRDVVNSIEKDRDQVIQSHSAHLEVSCLTDVEKAVLGVLPNSGEIYKNAINKLSDNARRFVARTMSHPGYY